MLVYIELLYWRDEAMRYYIGFLIAIGLSIIIILLLFAGGGSTSKTKVVAKPLISYANTDAIVSVSVDGPINATSEHESIRMSVSRTEALIQEFQGYDGTVVSSQGYPNTENAYYAFLSALSIAGFTLGNTTPALANDTGYCPESSRYDYRITEDGKNIEHFWSTDCGTATYKGNPSSTMQLFEAQLPDYGSFVSNLTL
jgi:hypothetical protein